MKGNLRNRSRLLKNDQFTTKSEGINVEEYDQVSRHSNSSMLMNSSYQKPSAKVEIKSSKDVADESIHREKTPRVKTSREKGHIAYNSIASPMKRTRTIKEWVTNPTTVKIIHCPACQREVLITDINNHLDRFCGDGMNEDTACKSSGNFSEYGEKLNIPPKHTRSDSNIIAQNGESIEAAKSLSKRNIQKYDLCYSGYILAEEKRSTKPSQKLQRTCKYNKPLNSVDSISLNKRTEIISCNIVDDKDGFLGKRNKFTKPILNSLDSEGMANLQQSDDALKMNPAPSKEMGIEKGNKWDVYGNDFAEAEKLDFKDIQHCGIDLTSGGGVEDAKGNSTQKHKVIHTESHIILEENKIINQEEQSEPYYLANFKLVLDTVLSNEEDRNLLNDIDQNIIKQFQDCPTAAQKLYIRLFQRKPGWFRCSKLDYPKIAEDLAPLLNSLVNTGFLDNEQKMTNLREVLNLLSAGDLKDLAKSLHIGKSTHQKGQNKQWYIDSLIKHGESQKTLFGSGSALLLKRAKEVLSSCVCVSSASKSVFSRLLLLFSMNIIPEDEDNKFTGQPQQLSTLMLVNMGKLVYPHYKITRQVPIFKDRDHMIKFAEAYQEKHEMSVALEVTGDLERADSFYPKAAKYFKETLSALKMKKETFSSTLPIHLRCFTAEWVYTKMCYLGVEVLQKKRLYKEAVGQLELLLQQDTYCTDCRGLWWERLALNVHQHLKQPMKALQIIQQGLEDNHVRFGRRLALVLRAKKIKSSASFQKKKDDEKSFDISETLLVEPRPVENITISGRRSADLGMFITPEVTKTGQVREDSVTYLSVEQYALSHYRQQGYDEGIHGETSTFTTLYGLFFWDIIFFDGIPDVFRGKFQKCPLDFYYDTFYTKRKEDIDRRLQEIKNCPTEDLLTMLEKSWSKYQGEICSCVTWERFADVEQAKQLVSCIGGYVLSDVFKHFAQDMRHWHSGMPDLVVWNSKDLKYRIVEVKGPGDRLSTKQQIWLDELVSYGATVEVCYVSAVGGKKLLKTEQTKVRES